MKKTGLGSSSALIVVMMGTLLDSMNVRDVRSLYELSYRANHMA